MNNSRRSAKVTVLAPDAGNLPTRERQGTVKTVRFRYAPGPFETLAYGSGGIPEKLRRNKVNYVLVAPFLSVGGTDTKHYVDLAENSYRFNPLRAAPDDLKRAHGVNERIAVENYAELIAFADAVLRRAGE